LITILLPARAGQDGLSSNSLNNSNPSKPAQRSRQDGVELVRRQEPPPSDVNAIAAAS